MSELIAVGVDGCKGGWIAASCYQKPGGWLTTSLAVISNVNELAAWKARSPDEVVMTLDVPIGLPENTRFRRCDEEARRRLGDRRSSVFMPPGRYLLDARSHTEAQRLVEDRRQEEPDTKGIGAQAWGIVPKIREVDELVSSYPESQNWLIEVHPEVCFRTWAGRPIAGKHSAVGQIERLEIVRNEFQDVESTIRKDLNAGDKVDLTDVLDAYAALWTALRIVREQHETLGQEMLEGIIARMLV